MKILINQNHLYPNICWKVWIFLFYFFFLPTHEWLLDLKDIKEKVCVLGEKTCAAINFSFYCKVAIWLFLVSFQEQIWEQINKKIKQVQPGVIKIQTLIHDGSNSDLILKSGLLKLTTWRSTPTDHAPTCQQARYVWIFE